MSALSSVRKIIKLFEKAVAQNPGVLSLAASLRNFKKLEGSLMNDDFEAMEADEDFETWEFLADEAFNKQVEQKDDDSPEALEPIPV